MKRIIFILSLILAPVLAASSNDKFKCTSSPIRLAYYEIGNLFYEKDGKWGGYDFKVANELMKRLGCKYQATVMKRARIWSELMNGGVVDMSTSGVPTKERLEKMWFIPYIQLRHRVFINQPTGLSTNFEQFYQNKFLKMGKVNGYAHSKFYDDKMEIFQKENRLIKFVDDERLFNALDVQAVHAVVSYPMVYSRYKKDRNTRGQIIMANWDQEEKMVASGLMLSKKVFSREEARHIQKIIENLRAEGLLASYLSEYLPSEDIKVALSYQSIGL